MFCFRHLVNLQVISLLHDPEDASVQGNGTGHLDVFTKSTWGNPVERDAIWRSGDLLVGDGRLELD